MQLININIIGKQEEHYIFKKTAYFVHLKLGLLSECLKILKLTVLIKAYSFSRKLHVYNGHYVTWIKTLCWIL